MKVAMLTLRDALEDMMRVIKDGGIITSANYPKGMKSTMDSNIAHMAMHLSKLMRAATYEAVKVEEEDGADTMAGAVAEEADDGTADDEMCPARVAAAQVVDNITRAAAGQVTEPLTMGAQINAAAIEVYHVMENKSDRPMTSAQLVEASATLKALLDHRNRSSLIELQGAAWNALSYDEDAQQYTWREEGLATLKKRAMFKGCTCFQH
jgi:hypothetical protein